MRFFDKIKEDLPPVEDDLPFEEDPFDRVDDLIASVVDNHEFMKARALSAGELAVDQFMHQVDYLSEEYGIEDKDEAYRIIEIINKGR